MSAHIWRRVDSPICCSGGGLTRIGRLVVSQTELAPVPRDLVLGRARYFLQKCTVTNNIRSGKTSNIPRRPWYTLCATSQTHTRLSASAPLCPSGQWPSGATSASNYLRISLIWSPFYLPPFFDGQRPAQSSEQDMSLSTIEER